MSGSKPLIAYTPSWQGQGEIYLLPSPICTNEHRRKMGGHREMIGAETEKKMLQ